MELMSFLKSTNVQAEMELMWLMMYQEQLMLLPYYYQQQSQLSSLLQHQENYISSSLTPMQAIPESPPPLSYIDEESVGQSEPLDLSLPPGLPERSRARSPHCKCPICGKQFSRPWLLKGKLERDGT